LLGIASAAFLRFESHGTHEHILLFLFLRLPNLEGQVPVFISPRNRIAQFYPRALRWTQPTRSIEFIKSTQSEPKTRINILTILIRKHMGPIHYMHTLFLWIIHALLNTEYKEKFIFH
jgi:hypothetical protein